eukprot:1146449_1
MWIESIKTHPLLYQPLDIDNNERVIHRLRTVFNVAELDAPYTVLTTKFEQNKALKRFATVFKANIDEKHGDYFKECTYKFVFDNANTKAIKYNESIQFAANTRATVLVSNEAVFQSKTEFELQRISIAANQNETASGLFYFDEEKQCIALDEHAIPSMKNDIMESILSAKYQIKYAPNLLNTKSAAQYGQEYQCASLTLAAFAVPIEIPAHQIHLMVAPLVDKTPPKNVQGKWFKYQSTLDDHGLLYGLATNFHQNKYSNPAEQQKVKLVLPNAQGKDSEREAYCLVDQKAVKFTVKGNGKSDPPFFYINIGQYGLKPNRYTLRNADKDSGYLTNWLLLASTDGIEWCTLKEHINAVSLKKEGPFEAAVWDINSDAYFSYFKILMSGTNHAGEWQFGCCGFELYGHLIDGFEYVYDSMTLLKSYLPTRMQIDSHIPTQINREVIVSKFDSNGSVSIHSKSEIIIQKDGTINANDCYFYSSLKSFEYESDFDANGIFYAIGTDFGAQTYANPAQSGLVDVVSSEMYKGESYSFIGRDNVRACTTHKQGSFFYVVFKKCKVQPVAYTLKTGYLGNYHLKTWNLEASNDGETWICLKKHESDDSLQGKYTSQTWTLNDINQFYSFFRIVMIGKAANDESNLCCCGMELYGDLLSVCKESESKEDVSEATDTVYGAGGGQISLISDSSIINYGAITSNGTTDKYFGGLIDIKCKSFKNLGRIESKTNGRIRIQCHSFENASDIHPEPILMMPWQYLILHSTNDRIVLDGVPTDRKKEFTAAALDAKYQITYFDSQNVPKLVEEVNMKSHNDASGSDSEAKSEDIETPSGWLPVLSNLMYSSVQVMVAPLESKAYGYGKVFHLNRYNINQNTPLQIDDQVNVRKFDTKTGSGGAIHIHSASDIIIQKDGAISANDCYFYSNLTSFKYKSDFDKNGIFYAIGTGFGEEEYQNPAESGLVDVITPGMSVGKSSSFIGRSNAKTYTADEEGSYFSVDLKKHKVKPTAYTLKNSYWDGSSLKHWNLEASNDGKTWICLKKHESEDLEGEYTSHTWTLSDMTQFYSFFRIVMTGESHEGNWHLCCSGMELYGDLLSGYEESESKEELSDVAHTLSAAGGAIYLHSDSSIINYGVITSNGTTDSSSFGGLIDI